MTVNTLRLWSARASNEFNLDYFQHGDYLKAVEEKNISENISKVLYPNDVTCKGQELRLKQQYFFVSCSIQDIVRRYLVKHSTFDSFPNKVSIQMNDTHPSLTIAELMRVFVDEQHLEWGQAWDITTRTCAYTNHTLLSEALEEWPVAMLENLLPRHLQIIYEINRRFLRDVNVRYVGDNSRARRMSIIAEGPEKKVRMAHLALVGSHSVNGVAELHTRLLKERVFRDFEEMYSGKINNKTNGITPRRWLLAANPRLAGLITEKIGKGWIKDLDELRKIETLAQDPAFQEQFDRVKRKNKQELAGITEDLTGFAVDPDSIFDVQIKRVHEYKRQLLNILHVIYCWLRLKEEPNFEFHPRTFLFGGKKIIPAADLSEQISTAGYEASGTGNMKLALNGALTIGTLDGANIEILEEVGRENIFIFGLTADEVAALRSSYNPDDYYRRDPVLRSVIDLIRDGFFSPEQPDLFHALIDNLVNEDQYLVLADFEDYSRAQGEVCKTYLDRKTWIEKAILNVARIGKFSSDRAIREYNSDIWHAELVHIPVGEKEHEAEPEMEEV
jgi:starch phosphorylase